MPEKYLERVIHHPVLTLRYFKNTSRRPVAPLRVVVSSKVAKKATVRNLIRRRIREIWRQLPVPPNLSVALYTKTAILDKSFAELKAIITHLSKQLH